VARGTKSDEHGDIAGQKLWSQRYRHPVEPEDCREIGQNLVGLFRLLAEWESKIEPGKADR